MPLPLNMFDDYQDSSILMALDAFQHIITNTVSIGFGINIISNTILLNYIKLYCLKTQIENFILFIFSLLWN